MATPTPFEQRELLWERHFNGELTYEELSPMLDALYEVPAKEPDVLQPYVSRDSLVEKQGDLVREKKYQNILERGMDEQAALDRAILDVRPVMEQPGTLNFEASTPPSWVSSIRDPELGIVFDETTRMERKATPREMFLEAFKPQVLSQGREYEDMLRQRRKLIAMTDEDMERHKQASIQYWMENGMPREDALKQAEKWEKETRERKRWVEGVDEAQAAIDRMATATPLLGPLSTAFDVLPGKVTAPFKVSDQEAGMLVESPLMAGMRGLGALPATIAAGITELGGAGEELPLVKESDTYRKAKGGFAEQAIANIARGQGLPQMFEAIEPIAEGLREVGKSAEEVYSASMAPGKAGLGPGTYMLALAGEDLPFWTGMTVEMGIPITGMGTAARATGKALSGAARQAARVTPKGGRALEAIANPMEYVKLKGQMALMDEMLESVQAGKSSEEVMKALDDAPWESAERWKRSLDGATLKRAVSETIAERVSTISTLKALRDEGRLTEEAVRQMDWSPTVGEFRYKAYPTILRSASDGRYIPTHYTFKGQRSDPIMMNGYALRWIDREHAAIQKAALRNPTLAKAFNQGELAADILSKVDEGKELARGLGRLGMDWENHLIKARLRRLYVEGMMTRNELATILPRLAKGVAPFAEMPAEYGAITIRDAMIASRRALSDNLSDSLFHMLPEDMVVIAGGTVAPRASVANPRKISAFYKDAKEHLGETRLRYRDGTYHLPWRGSPGRKGAVASTPYARKISMMIMDELGTTTIRRSKTYMDLLSAIQKGELDSAQRALYEKIVLGHLAKRHLDGFDMKTGGEQMRRAIIPDELSKGLISVREAESALQLSVKDMVQAVQFIAKDKIPWKKTPREFLHKMTKGQVPPEWADFQVKANNTMDTILPTLERELRESYKMAPSAEVGFNLVVQRTWLSIRDDFIARQIRFVDEVMDGDWERYAEFFLSEKMKQIRYDVRKGQGTFKEVTLDYRLFEMKQDAWDDIAQSYYGPGGDNKLSPVAAAKEHNKLFLSGEARKIPASMAYKAHWRVSNAKASNLMDFNLGNLERFTERLQQGLPDYFMEGGKPLGLKTLLPGKEPYPVALLDWMLGYRRGQAYSKLFDEFLEVNPEWTLDLEPIPTSPWAQLDLPVLKAAYKDFGNEVLDTLTQARVPPVDKDTFLVNFVDTMSELHIKAVQATTASQRANIISDINTTIANQQTLDVTYKNILKKLTEELEVPMADLAQRLEQYIETRMARSRLPGPRKTALSNALREKMFKMYSGIETDTNPFTVPVYSAVGDLIHHMDEAYRANGLMVGDSMFNGAALDRPSIQPLFSEIKGSTKALVFSTEDAALLDKLKDAANITRLQSMLETLRATDEGKWGRSVVGAAWTLSRRNMTSSLLAGFPGPNTRYLGMNVLTAHAIQAITLGTRRTGLAMPETMRALTFWFGDPNRVMFTSKTGKAWRAGELKQLLNRTNIGFTRGSVEFSESTAKDLLATAGLTLAGREMFRIPGTKLALEKHFYRLLPWVKNYLQLFADGTDNTFRRSVLFSALREGKTVEQASMLARRSLLDYGAISDWERKGVSKLFLFWAFRRMMMTETLNSVYRSISGPSNMPGIALGSARAQMRQHQMMETWLYEDDEARKRMFSMFKERFDNLDVARFGPASPAVETFETLINVMAGVTNLMDAKVRTGLLELLVEAEFRPEIATVADVIEIGTREGKQQQLVPIDFVYLSKSMGVWPEMKVFFGIKEVKGERRRAGRETYGVDDHQYRFEGREGAQLFRVWQLVSMWLGIRRNIADYPKALIAADVGTEDMVRKRYGEPHPMLYLLGADTALPLQDYEVKLSQFDRKIGRDLSNMLKELEND